MLRLLLCLCFLVADALVAGQRGVVFSSRGRVSLEAQKTSTTSEVFLRAPEFDLLSLQSWRRETLFRYSSAHQSEPLRILLCGALTLGFLFSGPLADAVGAPVPEPRIAYAVASAFFFGLFLREREGRRKKLMRIERESAVGDLKVVVRRNVLVGGGEERSVRSLRKEFRLLTIFAPAATLRDLEQEWIAPLKRRLDDAKVMVVLVSPPKEKFERKTLSFAEAADPGQWRDAFADLEANATAFFALGFDGRSRASGKGEPNFLEVLGSLFPPLAFQGDDDATTLALPEQANFYEALTKGHLDTMKALFFEGQEDDPAITAAVDGGGRLDPWTAQLGDDARPENLKITDADLFVSDDGLSATTTAIETVEGSKTLLALQRWRKRQKNDASWKLISHATVPFAPNTVASALLRCDHRGCVLLVNK